MNFKNINNAAVLYTIDNVPINEKNKFNIKKLTSDDIVYLFNYKYQLYINECFDQLFYDTNSVKFKVIDYNETEEGVINCSFITEKGLYLSCDCDDKGDYNLKFSIKKYTFIIKNS
jgi:hypothetical protein